MRVFWKKRRYTYIENTSSCLENVKTTLNMKFKSSQKMTLKKEWREYMLNAKFYMF